MNPASTGTLCHLYVDSPEDGNIVLTPESYPPLAGLAKTGGRPS